MGTKKVGFLGLAAVLACMTPVAVAQPGCDPFQTYCFFTEGSDSSGGPTGTDGSGEADEEGSGIESLMREAQARFFAVRGSYVTWPSCLCDGANSPYFPPNNFYKVDSEDPLTKAALVTAVRDCLRGCWTEYLHPSRANDIAGMSLSAVGGPSQFNWRDSTDPAIDEWTEFAGGLPKIGNIDPSAADSALGQLAGAVEKLRSFMQDGAQVARQATLGATTGCHTCDGFQSDDDPGSEDVQWYPVAGQPPALERAMDACWGTSMDGSPLYPPAPPCNCAQSQNCPDCCFGCDPLYSWGDWNPIPDGTPGLIYQRVSFSLNTARYGPGSCTLEGGTNGIEISNMQGKIGWANPLSLRGQIQAYTAGFTAGQSFSGHAMPPGLHGAFQAADGGSFSGAWVGGSTYGNETFGSWQEIPATTTATSYSFSGSWTLLSVYVVVTPDFDTKASRAQPCGRGAESNCSTCETSEATGKVNSVHWTLPLGKHASGKGLGYLTLDLQDISTVFSPVAFLNASLPYEVPGIAPQECFIGLGVQAPHLAPTFRGLRRQISSGSMLANILDIVSVPDPSTGETSFRIELHNRNHFGSQPDQQSDMLFPYIAGSAHTEYQVRHFVGTIEHPVSGLPVIGGRLRIIKNVGGLERYWEWTQVGNDWAMSEGAGSAFSNPLRREVVEIVPSTNGYTKTRSRFGANGVLAGRYRDVYARLLDSNNVPRGPLVRLSHTLDPDGLSLTTSWTYDSDPFSYSYGRIKQAVAWTGAWEQYFYSAATGLYTSKKSQYLGSPVGSAQCVQVDFIRGSLEFPQAGQTPPVTAQVFERRTSINGLAVSRSADVYWHRFGPNGHREITHIELASPSTAQVIDSAFVWDLLANPLAVSQSNRLLHSFAVVGPNSSNQGNSKAYASFSSDGVATQTVIVENYATGSFETIRTSGRLASAVNLYQQFGGSLLNFGNEYHISRTVRDRESIVVLEETTSFVNGNAIPLFSRTVTSQEPTGLYRPLTYSITRGSSTTSETVEYDCCHKSAAVSEEGLRTTYSYDGLGRVRSIGRQVESNAYVWTDMTYDGLNRVRSVTQRGTSGTSATAILQQSTTFNIAGQVTASYSSGRGTTAIATSLANSRLVTTTTYQDPDGSGPDIAPVRIETLYPDRTIESVAGSAVHPTKYEYGAVSDPAAPNINGFAARFTKVIKVGAANASSEWETTYVNQFGDSYKNVYADGAVAWRYFDNAGTLIRAVDPDGVTVLSASKGNRSVPAGITTFLTPYADWTLSVEDLNNSGTVDFAASALGQYGSTSDRIQLQQSFFEESSSNPGEYWKVNVLSQWTDAGPVELSRTRRRLDGEVQQTLLFGGSTPDVVASIVRTPLNGRVVSTVVSTDGQEETISEYGLSRSSQTRSTSGLVIGSTRTVYDEHARQIQAIDGRGTATTTDDRTWTSAYNGIGQIISVTTPAPAAGEPAQVTTQSYDALGRVTQVTSPGGAVRYTSYFPDGSIKKTYGDGGYPTEHTYDTQGRIKTLKTWHDFNESTGVGTSGAATTTWNYSPSRGWLTGKAYHNAPGPSYTYKPSGRLLTRTWARPVSTTYTYDGAGELAFVNYSDTTPDVTLRRDRRGQVESIIDAIGTRVFARDVASDVVTEDLQSGVWAPLNQENDYDPTHSRIQHRVLKGGQIVNSVSFGYDPTTGRYASVVKGGMRAEYGYELGSDNIASLTFRAGVLSTSPVSMTTTTQLDAIGRLRSITHDAMAASALDESFTYTYDARNRRARTDLADGSSWVYGYDAMDQVTSGKRYKNGGATPTNPLPGQQFEYAFDDIGNRTSSKVGGNASGTGLRTSTYTKNLLNQYTTRTHIRSSDILGFAPATNPVLVNNSVTDYRWLDYYQKLMNWSGNAASAHDVNIEWSVPQAFPPEEVRKVIAPPSTEVYMYDADGNLVQDAIWTYEWDAENRLISMSVRSGLDASIPRRRLEFAYDYASRRVEKRVFNWSTAAAAMAAPGTMLDMEATGAAGEVEDVPAGTAQAASGPGSIDIGGTWLLDSRYYFVWDGWNLSMELDGDMNPIRSYGWGLDLSRSEQGAGGVGGLLFETLHTGASAGTYHTAYDGNGNLVSLRNSAGLAVARYEYGPFGETVTSRDALAGVSPFRFSTKYQDAETGLLYYGYRYYSAGMGRWLNRDPIAEGDGPAIYNMCKNRTTNRFDTRGKWDVGGHFYTVFIVARCMGVDYPTALAEAYFAQLPDRLPYLDAIQAGLELIQLKPGKEQREYWLRVQSRLHSLHGGDAKAVSRLRACLPSLLKNSTLTNWQRGFLLHALGDSYSHVDSLEPNARAFNTLDGHLKQGVWPDTIDYNWNNYVSYVYALANHFGGSPNEEQMRCLCSITTRPLAKQFELQAEARERLAQIAAAHGMKVLTWAPNLRYGFGGVNETELFGEIPSQEDVARWLKQLEAQMDICCEIK